MEHFKEVLNRPQPTVVPNIQEASIDLDVNTDVPTRREVIQAINSLKNGKAPGNDNLNAELFKADPELAATILTPLFTKIWEQEETPSDWSTGVIIKIPKKGSLSDCNNWRRVTLLSVPSKIFCKVIIQRITKAVDDVLRNEQAGFRKGCRCADQIFTLRNILEQCSEWNRQLYVNFIDYEKAFDRHSQGQSLADIESVWHSLTHCQYHQMLLFELHMLCWSGGFELPNQNWCTPGMCHVIHVTQHCYRLGPSSHYGRSA